MEDMEIEVENNIFAVGVDIPEDIIQDILLRLPVKSLARFRCVSKPWLFYISSYKFSKAHLKFSTKDNKFIIFGSQDRPMDLYTCPIQSIIEGSNSGVDQVYPLTSDNILTDRIRSNNCPFVGEYYGIWLVGSCNGLVCVHLVDKIILLWNPTTRETKRLPYSGTNPDWIMYMCFSFAFGYDELHDDYKVVELWWLDPQNVGPTDIGVKVYSLRTNSWKILSNWPGGHIFDGMGVFLNGAVHWLVGEYGTRDERVIVSLDLATDTFTEFTLPILDVDDVAVEVDILEDDNDVTVVEEDILEEDDDDDDDVAVVEEHILEDDDVPVEVDILEGRLALYCRHNTHMDVWVMKEYGVSKSWSKAVRIPFLLDLRDHHHSTKPRPLFFSVDRKVLINYGTCLRIYDLNNPQPHQFSSTFSVETTTYFESLISPNLDNKVIIGWTMPPEIIKEILLRLPVKSLMCFKSVSKEWLSFISSSNFVKAHLKTSTTTNNVKLIFGPTAINSEGLYTCSINSVFADPDPADLTGTVYSVGDQNHSSFDHVLFERVLFDFPVVARGARDAERRIVGSCNGLVCLTLSHNIILVNPATRKSRILPNSSADDHDRKYYNFSYSFGYDEVNGDYKVVEFMSFCIDDQTNVFNTFVEVYSMRTNSWKALLNWPGGDTCNWMGKCLNGSIHWLVQGLSGGLAKRVIAAHDLATDTFVQLPLPNNPDIDDATTFVEVIILGGCLALYCTHHNNMDVWVMKEYGVRESWARVVEIPFFMDLRFLARPRPVFLRGDGKILINYGSSLKIYDPCNPQPHQPEPHYAVVAKTYVESLVSLTLDEDMIN